MSRIIPPSPSLAPRSPRSARLHVADSLHNLSSPSPVASAPFRQQFPYPDEQKYTSSTIAPVKVESTSEPVYIQNVILLKDSKEIQELLRQQGLTPEVEDRMRQIISHLDHNLANDVSNYDANSLVETYINLTEKAYEDTRTDLENKLQNTERAYNNLTLRLEQMEQQYQREKSVFVNEQHQKNIRQLRNMIGHYQKNIQNFQHQLNDLQQQQDHVDLNSNSLKRVSFVDNVTSNDVVEEIRTLKRNITEYQTEVKQLLNKKKKSKPHNTSSVAHRVKTEEDENQLRELNQRIVGLEKEYQKRISELTGQNEQRLQRLQECDNDKKGFVQEIQRLKDELKKNEFSKAESQSTIELPSSPHSPRSASSLRSFSDQDWELENERFNREHKRWMLLIDYHDRSQYKGKVIEILEDLQKEYQDKLEHTRYKTLRQSIEGGLKAIGDKLRSISKWQVTVNANDQCQDKLDIAQGLMQHLPHDQPINWKNDKVEDLRNKVGGIKKAIDKLYEEKSDMAQKVSQLDSSLSRVKAEDAQSLDQEYRELQTKHVELIRELELKDGKFGQYEKQIQELQEDNEQFTTFMSTMFSKLGIDDFQDRRSAQDSYNEKVSELLESLQDLYFNVRGSNSSGIVSATEIKEIKDEIDDRAIRLHELKTELDLVKTTDTSHDNQIQKLQKKLIEAETVKSRLVTLVNSIKPKDRNDIAPLQFDSIDDATLSAHETAHHQTFDELTRLKRHLNDEHERLTTELSKCEEMSFKKRLEYERKIEEHAANIKGLQSQVQQLTKDGELSRTQSETAMESLNKQFQECKDLLDRATITNPTTTNNNNNITTRNNGDQKYHQSGVSLMLNRFQKDENDDLEPVAVASSHNALNTRMQDTKTQDELMEFSVEGFTLAYLQEVCSVLGINPTGKNKADYVRALNAQPASILPPYKNKLNHSQDELSKNLKQLYVEQLRSIWSNICDDYDIQYQKYNKEPLVYALAFYQVNAHGGKNVAEPHATFWSRKEKRFKTLSL